MSLKYQRRLISKAETLQEALGAFVLRQEAPDDGVTSAVPRDVELEDHRGFQKDNWPRLNAARSMVTRRRSSSEQNLVSAKTPEFARSASQLVASL